MTANASWLEVTWTGLLVLALLFSLARLRRALGDDDVQRKRHEGRLMQLVARANVLIEIERVIVLGALALVGLILMGTPPSPHGSMTFASVALALALIVVAVIKTVGSIVGKHIGDEVLKAAEEDERK